jgi:hypothetical protein
MAASLLLVPGGERIKRDESEQGDGSVAEELTIRWERLRRLE